MRNKLDVSLNAIIAIVFVFFSIINYEKMDYSAACMCSAIAGLNIGFAISFAFKK